MENQLIRTDQKLSMILQHASMGLAETDTDGQIIHLNPKGHSLLKPIRIALGVSENNLYQVLEHIAPAVLDKIKQSSHDAGNIISNEMHSFSLSFGGETIQRNFNFTVIKLYTDCTIVSFDDITQKRQRDDAIRQLLSDKEVAQGKFEIASNILHDIGNALVGLGSFIGRIKRSLEQTKPENLQKLSEFLDAQQEAMNTAFGKTKAGAVIKMLNGINETQKTGQEEIRKSITEQLNIITHIQEILLIHRQYANGHDSQEKNPVNLKSIINDCMSMVMVTLEKRGIKIAVEIQEKLPAIKGDRTRLMQVILNILKNSIEAIDICAPEKNISITASSYSGRVVIEIKDNGHGFDGSTGTQLFERGFTTKASGSGIGLSNCRSIIESHDGTIDMTSEGFGKGALTTIEFKI